MEGTYDGIILNMLHSKKSTMIFADVITWEKEYVALYISFVKNSTNCKEYAIYLGNNT